MSYNFLKQTPPATLNLIIVNCVVFLLQVVIATMGYSVENAFALHFFKAEGFGVWQLVSYMFLHGNLTHLLLNMFSLWMFGRAIEWKLGTKRFLILYFICGIGAGICQELWQLGEYYVEGLQNYEMVNIGSGVVPMQTYLNLWMTVGASGACYGILFAFAFFYPNERIMLLIPPIPLKSKYFIAFYIVIEAYSAFSTNSNIAHFAHLGGMLFSWITLWTWRRESRRQQERGRIYINEEKPTILQRIRNIFDYERRRKPTKQKPTTSHNADYEYNMRRRQQEERLDAILDKVRQSGYDSLTTQEKQELFRISKN